MKYEDIFDDQPPDLGTVLREVASFSRDDVINILARLNFILLSTKGTFDTSLQLTFMKHFLPKNALDNAIKLVRAKRVNALVTRAQLLYIMRCCLSYCRNGSKRVKDDIHLFGRLILSFASHLEPELTYSVTTTMSPSSRRNLMYPALTRNMFFNRVPDFEPHFALAWQIFSNNQQLFDQRQFVKFESCFRKSFGFTAKEALMIAVGIYVYYELLIHPDTFTDLGRAFELPASHFDAVLPEAKPIADKVISMLTGPGCIVRRDFQSNFDFNDFYQKPIVQLSNKARILIDPECLRWRCTDGLYWLLIDKIAGEEKNSRRRHINAVYGQICHANITQYLKMISTVAQETENVTFIEEQSYISHPQSDVIIAVEDVIFVFEVTIHGLSMASLLKANNAKVKNELDRLLLRKDPDRKESSGKLIQIDETIKAVRRGEYKQLRSTANDLRFVPVLIVLGKFPVSVFFGDIIQSVIARRQTELGLERETTEGCLFLDAIDVDSLLWALEEKGVRLGDVLLDYQKVRYQDNFTNFLQEKLHKSGWSSIARNAFSEFRKEAGDFLFGRPL